MKFAFHTHAAPARALSPVSQVFPRTSRSWLDALVSFLIILKPLALGIVRAVVTAFNPQLSLEERKNRQRVRDAITLNRLAREVEGLQPNLAAELRSFVGRD